MNKTLKETEDMVRDLCEQAEAANALSRLKRGFVEFTIDTDEARAWLDSNRDKQHEAR